ncbi:hypothetical protein BLAT2472_20166 [Burkholderia latens]
MLLSESIKPVVRHYLLRFVTPCRNAHIQLSRQLICINI